MPISNLLIGMCEHCRDWTLWRLSDCIFPALNLAPPPNADLSSAVRADYLEAATVVAKSPRAACALLRLGLQKLCKELGEPGKNINDDIGSLVRKGLPARFQKALDVVRVVGNSAAHPGELDLTDDRDSALKMFSFLNLLADAAITQPKSVEAFFDALPEGAKAAVKKRDGA